MGALLHSPNKAVSSAACVVVGLEACTTMSGLDRHGNNCEDEKLRSNEQVKTADFSLFTDVIIQIT